MAEDAHRTTAAAATATDRLAASDDEVRTLMGAAIGRVCHARIPENRPATARAMDPHILPRQRRPHPATIL